MANSRLMMMVAVVAGLLSTALAFVYLQQTRSSIENQQIERKERVLVAARDLDANTPINAEEDLRVEEIPARSFKFLAGAAVNAQERNSLEGRRIYTPIPAGMPLLYSHLTEIVDLTISPAARAMTIRVDEAGGLSGLLVPGDRVDVVVTRELPQDPGLSNVAIPEFDPNRPEASIGAVLGQVMSQSIGSAANTEWIAEIIVSNVKVLAVGQKLSLSRQQFVFAPEDMGYGGDSSVSTITLELTTDQALLLTGSTGAGSNPITLLLRPKEAGESSRGFQPGFR